jgi:predicted ATPase
VAELLEHVPKLKFLVTSRERLNLQSEWIFNLEGLTVPANGSAEELESFSAPQLFLQRARRLNRNFGQQPAERHAIGQICRLVGGIPLALELAAAWTKALACHEIAREIERNLDFLAIAVRDLPERHRNMRAVFDYSWQMLTAQERQLFQRLSVCRGGFTWAAAEAIAGEVPWTDNDLRVDEAGEVQLTHRQPDVLKVLSGLVDKSFLQHTASGRYEVHELMRQYGAAQLRSDPDNEARSHNLHAAYYLNLLAHQEPLMKGRGQRLAHQRVAQEFENIKLGWLHAAEQGQAELLIRAFGAFWLSCVERNVFYELVNVCVQARLGLEKCLPLAGRPQSSIELALGVMLLGEGFMSFRIGDFSIADKTDQAIAIFRSLKANGLTALALDGKGVINQSMGDYEAARQCFAESAELSQKVGDRWLTGYCLNDLGLVLHLMGDTTAAQELSWQSLDILTELADRRGKAFAFNNLGLYAFHLGDYAEADWLYRECIKLRQVNNDQWGVATGIIHLAAVARARGETQQAYRHLLEAIRRAMKVRAVPVVLDALVELALLLADEGIIERAEEILQLCLHHPGLAKPAQAKAEQQLATLRGVANPLPTAQLPEDEAARELDTLLARLLNE